MFRLINISKEYQGENNVRVLKNINYNFPSSGIVSIVGKSGSGKTTLLNILGGLENPTSGSITYKGHDVNTLSFKRDVVSFVFQDFNLLTELSVTDNLKIINDFNDNQISELLESVDMTSKVNTKTKHLSIGEKQRLAIARALAKNFEVILLDEPTGNLDTENRENIYKILKNISSEKLVIMVTHDMENAIKYSDHIIEIKDGVISNNDDVSNNNNVTFILEPETENILNDSNNKNNSKNHIFNSKIQYKYALSLFKDNRFRFVVTILMFILSSILTLTQLNLAHYNQPKVLYNAINDGNDFAVPVLDSVENKPTDELFIYSSGENFYDKISKGENSPLRFIQVNDNSNEGILDEFILYLFDDDIRDPLLIDGRLPENKNEVIVSDFFSIYKFNSTDVIGEEIPIYINYLNTEIKLKVVGVFKTDYKELELFKKNYDNLYLKNNKDRIISNYFNMYTQKDLIFVDIMNEPITLPASNFTLSSLNTQIYVSGSSNIKYRRLSGEFDSEVTLPTNKNEILVSTSFFNRYIKGDIESTLNSLYDYKDIRETINKNKYLDILNLVDITRNVKIVGVVESDADIIVTSEFADEIEEKLVNYAITGYALQELDLLTIEELTNNDVYFNFIYLEPIYLVANVLEGPIMTLILVIVIILILLSALSLLLYCQNTVKTKKREIAIIKSFGVSNKKILNVFLIHNFILALISTIIGFVMSIVFLEVINNIVGAVNVFNIDYSLLLFEPISLIIVIFTSLIILLIGTILPFINIRKISIATELKV